MADSFKITGVWEEDGNYYYTDDAGNLRTKSMNPVELLTAAVVSCTGRTMHAIINKMKIVHQGFTITGLARMADDKISRVASLKIDASIHGTQMSDAQQSRVLELTEKYCVITQTLKQGADVDLSIRP